jgi:hypothetical protein
MRTFDSPLVWTKPAVHLDLSHLRIHSGEDAIGMMMLDHLLEIKLNSIGIFSDLTFNSAVSLLQSQPVEAGSNFSIQSHSVALLRSDRLGIFYSF